MNREWELPPLVEELSDGELSEALTAGARDDCWVDRAAVGLVVDDGRWLGRQELRQAVETLVTPRGDLLAWVDWDRVSLACIATSPSALGLLAVACSLGGVGSDRPLSELLAGLDPAGITCLLGAVSAAAGEHLASV